MEYSNVFVCLLGIGTVFIGLICIIVICSILGVISRKFFKEDALNSTTTNNISTTNSSDIPNRQEMIAAVSAAIAEELGKDVSAIRILSVKKL